MKRTVFVLALLAPLMSSVCCAQTSPSTPEQTFQRLGQRLDEAQQLLAGQISQTSGMVPSGAITQAINALESIVLEFRDNNWVRVKGFKVKVGLPPSIDVDLEIPSSSGSH